MKTALYTIFRCTNYGAVLQAFALARTLRGMLGEDAVDVINHRMDPSFQVMSTHRSDLQVKDLSDKSNLGE